MFYEEPKPVNVHAFVIGDTSVKSNTIRNLYKHFEQPGNQVGLIIDCTCVVVLTYVCREIDLTI